jgi:hypothetical protein
LQQPKPAQPSPAHPASLFLSLSVISLHPRQRPTLPSEPLSCAAARACSKNGRRAIIPSSLPLFPRPRRLESNRDDQNHQRQAVSQPGGGKTHRQVNGAAMAFLFGQVLWSWRPPLSETSRHPWRKVGRCGAVWWWLLEISPLYTRSI